MPPEFRPWGFFEMILDRSDEFKFKRITVYPGHRLSLQKHEHRQEFWSFVSGRGVVRLGDTIDVITAGQCLHVGRGVVHRIANPGPDPLVIMETQLGRKAEGHLVSEDDVIRLEDDYGRVTQGA